MKRSIITALLICLAPCFVKAQGQFVLKGKIGNAKDTAKIYLWWGAGKEERGDSAILQNGQFSFAGSLTGPVRATLILYTSVKSWPEMRQIFLENGTICVNSPDSLKNATITGSTINDDDKRLQAALQPFMVKRERLLSESAGAAGIKNDTAFRSEILKKLAAIDKEQKMAVRKFISENPESYISLISIKDVVGNFHEYSDIASLLFNGLSKKLRNSAEGKEMAERIARLKAIRIGAVAPDFTLNDTSGVPVKLSSFRGRYVLLDFWASWCKPCRAENKYVVKSYHKYKEKNFTVLSVSLDKDKEKWLKAVHEDHLAWTQLSDLTSWYGKTARLFELYEIPQNFLIDPSGKIIASRLRREALDEKLSELLK